MKNKTKTQLDKIPSRMVKGQKVFTLRAFIDSQLRTEPPVSLEEGPQGDLFSGEEGEETEAHLSAAASAGTSSATASDDGMFRQSWRLTSADMVWPTTPYGLKLLVDLGTHDNGKALKAGVRLIDADQPSLMKDHSESINAVFGHIEKGVWETSADIKPGINAQLSVDPELFPAEAKRLAKGFYRSGSIGVSWDLVKSHPDMDDWDFIEQQGKKVKGQIVRLLLMKVTKIWHFAVVPALYGADKNAGFRNIASIDAQHNDSVGGQHMEKFLWDLINEACGLLKCQALSEGLTEPPEGFAAGFKKHITALLGEREAVKTLNAGLTDIGEKFGLKDAEGKVEPQSVLAAIPERLKRAVWGDAYLTSLREETKKVFCSAVVDPEQTELSELNKKILERIENSEDLGYLNETSAHYSELAKARFGLNRSSPSEELPDVDGKGTNLRTGPAALISEGVSDLWGRNKKGGAK